MPKRIGGMVNETAHQCHTYCQHRGKNTVGGPPRVPLPTTDIEIMFGAGFSAAC